MIRRVSLQILLERWVWTGSTLTMRDSGTIDITTSCRSYNYTRSIGNPVATCSLVMVAQRKDQNIMDYINVMDVIKVLEWGTVKFIGYITAVGYIGEIGDDGKANRAASISCESFGGLLVNRSIGVNLGAIINKADVLVQASLELVAAISDKLKDNTLPYAQAIQTVLSNFYDVLTKSGGTLFETYLNRYLDYQTGMIAKQTSGVPKQFTFYTGSEEALTLYNILFQIVQAPFNELWLDNGPRTVQIEGNTVQLPGAKEYLIFRPTPFDGIVGGYDSSAFSHMSSKRIDRPYLRKFDLAKDGAEAYSLFIVVPSAYDASNLLLTTLGQAKYDSALINKYLLKTMKVQLYYTSVNSSTSTAPADGASDLDSISGDYAETLYNWFKLNDRYLKGNVTYHVPADPSLDIRIGDKIEISGMTGYFYAEAVTHSWNYGGPMTGIAKVTRGWNYAGNTDITLTDKLFRRSVV